MHLSGFADEAADGIDGQLRATAALGWRWMAARQVDGGNLHDLDEAAFETVCARLQAAGVGVSCLGSAIGNWSRDITGPFAPCLEQARRALPRMQRLGVKLLRIMSYPVLSGRRPDDQFEGERFKRLRTLTRMCADAGIQAAHENCANYGGMGWTFTQRLLDNVRGLKLVFDTGNPPLSEDILQPPGPDGRRPRQSSWAFYEQVRDHIVDVHIKDARWDAERGQGTYTMPGEGQGELRRILADLLRRGYQGALAIEPHLAVQIHAGAPSAPAETRFATYVEYGRRLEQLLAELRAGPGDGRTTSREV